MTNQLKDRISGIALLISGIALYFFLIPKSIQVESSLSQVGPDFFPKLVALLLILSSLFLLYSGFKKKAADVDNTGEVEDEETDIQVSKPWIAAGVFILMVIYVYIAEPIGFLASTILIMFAIMAVLKVRKWYLYLVMLAVIFILKLIFENLMYIQLP